MQQENRMVCVKGEFFMEKAVYERPVLFAETFVANQYCAACTGTEDVIAPTTVICQSQDHLNKAENTMFTDSNTACKAKYNPGVGYADGDVFHTQFEACDNAAHIGCNRVDWLASGGTIWGDGGHYHEGDGIWVQGTFFPSLSQFIMHDTTVSLSFATKYMLS